VPSLLPFFVALHVQYPGLVRRINSGAQRERFMPLSKNECCCFAVKRRKRWPVGSRSKTSDPEVSKPLEAEQNAKVDFGTSGL